MADKFPTFEEWLPGWLQRQKERRRGLKSIIEEVRVRNMRRKETVDRKGEHG